MKSLYSLIETDADYDRNVMSERTRLSLYADFHPLASGSTLEDFCEKPRVNSVRADGRTRVGGAASLQDEAFASGTCEVLFILERPGRYWS